MASAAAVGIKILEASAKNVRNLFDADYILALRHELHDNHDCPLDDMHPSDVAHVLSMVPNNNVAYNDCEPEGPVEAAMLEILRLYECMHTGVTTKGRPFDPDVVRDWAAGADELLAAMRYHGQKQTKLEAIRVVRSRLEHFETEMTSKMTVISCWPYLGEALQLFPPGDLCTEKGLRRELLRAYMRLEEAQIEESRIIQSSGAYDNGEAGAADEEVAVEVEVGVEVEVEAEEEKEEEEKEEEEMEAGGQTFL